MKSLKYLLSIALLLVGSALSFAQTSVDVTVAGGSIGSAGTMMVDTLSTIVATNDPTNGLQLGELGTFHFVAPSFSSGSLTTGGSFGAGGSLTINIPNYIISDFNQTVTATFVSGTWTKVRLANGSIYYTLSATITTSSGDSGALVLQTVSMGTALWNGGAPLAFIDVNLQLP